MYFSQQEHLRGVVFWKFVFWPNLSMILEKYGLLSISPSNPTKNNTSKHPPNNLQSKLGDGNLLIFFGWIFTPKNWGGKISPQFESIFFRWRLGESNHGRVGCSRQDADRFLKVMNLFYQLLWWRNGVSSWWWQLKYWFMFTPIWRRCSIWRAYFANLLKPATGSWFFLAGWCAA